jgi:putative transferase (TIGR04331 family)
MTKNSIFVALTKNEKFWDKSKDIVLLGTWCLSDFERKNESKILPYPIKLKDSSFSKFDNYNQELYSKYLKIFTKLLNEEHKVNYSLRYWDIVLGSFLYRYIGVMHEKYLTIQSLIEQHDKFECFISDTNQSNAVIVDELSFMELIQDDDYNFEMYSKVLSFFKINGTKIKLNRKWSDISFHNSNNWIRKIIELIFSLIAHLKAGEKVIFMKNPYLDLKFIAKLAIFSKYRVKIKLFERYKTYSKYNVEMRKHFQGYLSGNDKFELFLKTVLPFDLPMSVVENYKYLNKIAKEQYPSEYPDIIFSANSWYYDELFKLWAAGALRKSKLLGVQHGGNYGISRYFSQEKYELGITDFYLTWGWIKYKYSNIIPFGSTKMAFYKKESIKSDDILFVMTSQPEYFCDLRFIPSERVAYFENQKLFLDNISSKLLKKFRIRPYPAGDQSRLINLWSSYSKEVKLDGRAEKFLDSLNNCKLYVTDHLMTTYLESLKMNIPTIIFLDKKYPNGLICQNMTDDFQKLEDAGILFFSPKSAALAINKLGNNIDQWWFQPKVQNARKDFCNKFAKNLEDPISDLDNLFTKLI